MSSRTRAAAANNFPPKKTLSNHAQPAGPRLVDVFQGKTKPGHSSGRSQAPNNQSRICAAKRPARALLSDFSWLWGRETWPGARALIAENSSSHVAHFHHRLSPCIASSTTVSAESSFVQVIVHPEIYVYCVTVYS